MVVLKQQVTNPQRAEQCSQHFTDIISFTPQNNPMKFPT